MNTEDKIKELLNECPINKAHLTEDELSAYHQGLRCGAYNMAEWKDDYYKKLLDLLVKSGADADIITDYIENCI